MEDEFASVYRGLIARLDPDPARLRRGLLALRRRLCVAEPPAPPDLQIVQKCDIPDTGTCARSVETQEGGEQT